MDGLAKENVLRGAGETVDEFHFALSELLPNIDAIWDADEVCVLEFDSGTLVTVIEQDVETGCFEVAGDLFACGQQCGIGDVGDGDDKAPVRRRIRKPGGGGVQSPARLSRRAGLSCPIFQNGPWF